MDNPMQSIFDLLSEIKKCETAGATTGAVAMAFICIDTMAFLSLPVGRDKQGRADFIAWVDTYLKATRRSLISIAASTFMVRDARCFMRSARKWITTSNIRMRRNMGITMAASMLMTPPLMSTWLLSEQRRS